jgi:hypothetical protein
MVKQDLQAIDMKYYHLGEAVDHARPSDINPIPGSGGKAKKKWYPFVTVRYITTS